MFGHFRRRSPVIPGTNTRSRVARTKAKTGFHIVLIHYIYGRLSFSTMVIPIAVFVFTTTMALAASVRTKPRVHIILADSLLSVLKSGEDMEHHIEGITRISGRSPGSEFSINHRYEMLNGYSAHVTGASLSRIFSCPEVEYVEADAIVSIYDGLHEVNEGLVTEVNDVPAELRDDPGELGGRASRKPVEIILGDSGIDRKHPWFLNRDGRPAVDDGDAFVDFNGHGTMVAGRAVGNIYGVTTWPTIFSIKVFSKSGTAPTTNVIAAVQLACDRFASTRFHTIFIISFATEFDRILNKVVNDAVRRGLHIVVPAGDHNINVKESVSPATAVRAIAVGAIESCGPTRVASFSNYGPAVNIFAEGTSALVPLNGGGWGTASGTAMSAALVAGLLADRLSHQDNLVSPRQLKQDLTSHAIKDVRDPTGTNKWRAVRF
ncbi:peptidase S8/S53 domain-containing protein [Cantharellus anzutake]|uniref:peptidase S8/S53 domain-containing protein n=1 Tax=Cantharellus anzutake TaxID=1750568 RepID=UPI0019070F47|nr:peptidase S8/S53 domain-containing protein [Cantharellus anzutake]KAF8332421.1 peptidase S8/S53 domain-containing protein [Cantharellus anzutake]